MIIMIMIMIMIMMMVMIMIIFLIDTAESNEEARRRVSSVSEASNKLSLSMHYNLLLPFPWQLVDAMIDDCELFIFSLFLVLVYI